MFYYDSDGEMAWTADRDAAARHHILTMLGANNYPAYPDAAGQLYKALGAAPINISRAEAIAAVRRTLRELGLGGLAVSDVLEYIDDSWSMVITVGE